jgi:hypothetical protein
MSKIKTKRDRERQLVVKTAKMIGLSDLELRAALSRLDGIRTTVLGELALDIRQPKEPK